MAVHENELRDRMGISNSINLLYLSGLSKYWGKMEQKLFLAFYISLVQVPADRIGKI